MSSQISDPKTQLIANFICKFRTLVYPGVPAFLPSSLSNLVGLQAFYLTGGNTIPAGSIVTPSTNSVISLSYLHTISIQATSLTGPIPDNAFAASANLTSVTLVNNPQLGDSLPSSLFNASLITLVVNGQSLSGQPFPSSGPGKAAQTLKTLDLSSNSLSGPLPNLSNFSALVELNFDSNQFTNLSGYGFPAGLTTISLEKNPDLTGSVPIQLCGSKILSSCDFRGTQLGVNGTNATTGMCGSCLFGDF
jgi:hypothetical protein